MQRRSLKTLLVSIVAGWALVAVAMLAMSWVAAANPVRLDSLTVSETLWLMAKLFCVPLALLFGAIGVLCRSNRPTVEPADPRPRAEALGH